MDGVIKKIVDSGLIFVSQQEGGLTLSDEYERNAVTLTTQELYDLGLELIQLAKSIDKTEDGR